MSGNTSISFTKESFAGALMSCAPIGIIEVDEGGLIVQANPFVTKMFGYGNEEMKGRHIDIFVPGARQKLKKKQSYACLIQPKNNSSRAAFTLHGIHKNGAAFPVEFSYGCFENNSGTKSIAYLPDLSEQEKQTELLKASEQNMRLLIEHTPAAVAMFDREMRYIAVSRRWLKDYRLAGMNIIGKSHYDVFPEIPERWKELHRRSLAGEELHYPEDPFPGADGRIDWVQWEMCPWYNERSEIGGVILFTELITEQKMARERLEHYAMQLEAMVEEQAWSLKETVADLEKAKKELSRSLEKEKELGLLKSNFISIASHEFRTPLSTIQLSATLIDRYSSPLASDDITRHIKKIKNATANLTGILSDFSIIEKLEAGKILLCPADFDLASLAAEIAAEMRPEAKENQHIFYRHTGAERIARLDSNLIKTIINNLVSNAIKYSGEGTVIEVETSINERFYKLSVKDNGIGIPEADQKHLFEAFFRADNTGKIPGTGLGLNIVERYTRMMDGEIKFESRLGKGTSFTIIFPRSPSAKIT